MKIYLATDHAGLEFKNKIKNLVEGLGHEAIDCGAFELDPQDDYPDFIKVAARNVSEDKSSRGIVLGRSGAGECIVANKIKGVRAFLAVNEHNVQLAREHNDANVMSIGSELVDENNLETLIKLFIETPFTNEERHVRRIDKISQIENE